MTADGSSFPFNAGVGPGHAPKLASAAAAPGDSLPIQGAAAALRVPNTAHAVRSVDDHGTMTGVIPVVGHAQATTTVGPTPPGVKPMVVSGVQPVLPAEPQVPVAPGGAAAPVRKVAQPAVPLPPSATGMVPTTVPGSGSLPPATPGNAGPVRPRVGMPAPPRPQGGALPPHAAPNPGQFPPQAQAMAPYPGMFAPVPGGAMPRPGMPLPPRPGYQMPGMPAGGGQMPPGMIPLGGGYPPFRPGEQGMPGNPYRMGPGNMPFTPGSVYPSQVRLSPLARFASPGTMIPQLMGRLPTRRSQRQSFEEIEAKQIEVLREAEKEAREAEVRAMMSRSFQEDEDVTVDDLTDFDWDDDQETWAEWMIRKSGRWGETLLMFGQAARWGGVVLVTMVGVTLLIFALDRSASDTDQVAAGPQPQTVVQAQAPAGEGDSILRL